MFLSRFATLLAVSNSNWRHFEDVLITSVTSNWIYRLCTICTPLGAKFSLQNCFAFVQFFELQGDLLHVKLWGSPRWSAVLPVLLPELLQGWHYQLHLQKKDFCLSSQFASVRLSDLTWTWTIPDLFQVFEKFTLLPIMVKLPQAHTPDGFFMVR